MIDIGEIAKNQANEDLLDLAYKLMNINACCIDASTGPDPEHDILVAIKAVKTLWRVFALKYGIVKRYNLSNLNPEKISAYTTRNRVRYRQYYRENRDKILTKQRANLAVKKANILQIQKENKNG